MSRRFPWRRVTSSTFESNGGMLHTVLEWSPCSNWLAIASETSTGEGQVDVISSTGVKSTSNALTRLTTVNCVQWHPAEMVLAIGWTDGALSITNSSRDTEITIDESPITIQALNWTHNGKALCVLREDGHMSLYSFSSKKNLNLTKASEYSMNAKPVAMCKKHLYERSSISREPDEIEDDSEELQEFNASLKERNRKMGVRLNSNQLISRPPIGTVFLVADESENLHCVQDNGDGAIAYKFDSPVNFLGFYDAKSLLVAMTSDGMLHQLHVDENEKWIEKWKVKLSGKVDVFRLLLIENMLLITYREKEMRVWDLESEESGTISLQTAKGFDPEDCCVCAAYSKKKGVISAGTSDGKVANWRRRVGENGMESTWRLQNPHEIGSEIHALSWSPVSAVLAVNSGSNLIIVEQDHNLVCLKNKIALVQSSPTSFVLLNVSTGVTQDLKLPLTVVGVHLGEKQLVVWNKDTIMTFDVQTSLATLQSTSFTCTANEVVIYQQTLYCIEGDKINARTIQGTVRQILSLPEMEGDPVRLHCNRSWLAVASSNGFIRIYDLAKKEARQEYHSKYVVEAADDFVKWASIKVNISGNRVACTYYEDPSNISERLLVWDAETDSVCYFSFDKGMTDQQEYDADAELANTSTNRPVTAAARKMEREQSRFRMMLHRPGTFEWDENDSRFLVCEAVHNTPEMADNLLLSMFVTADHGIQLHDLQKKSTMCDHLIGVSVPSMYFLKKSEFDEDDVRGERTIGRLVVSRTLREFAGIEQCDDATRKAMLDFSLYLTLGHMDEAFKAIKFIKSDSVWEQMASMSVKTRRLDVAAVCLGHMKNVRGARALRKAQATGESPAMQCAAIAIELGMLEEAEALYASTGRFDMVNKIEQAQNSWNQAFEVANRHDRIHLRNTYYNYAKYLESVGASDGAIENFERSDTHTFEVPRMFANNPKILEIYIRRKREPALQRWWASYLESIGEYDGAINFYVQASDPYAVVRIKTLLGRLDEAASLALESGDKAACYHMARTYENEENYVQSVNFYTKAHAFSSAIRIAKEHDMRDKLANLCLMAGGSELVEAARYYEDIPGYAHKAVMLYHKAGMIGRALDLAFRTEQFTALDLVAKDLDNTCEPTVLKRAAEFFENNQNYEKAVELLCMAREFADALNLCRRKNVNITEKIAELMTPTKDTSPNASERKELLLAIAEVCVQQGSYIVAAKKYTQAGDKIKAMKSLLRSGDTSKIRFFANTARNKEIYILAANFLQSTNWQGNAEIIKDIETFYAKSQSSEHLANFYVACAYMEIESWNDFDKAAEALEQARKCIEKALLSDAENKSLLSLQKRVSNHLTQLGKFNKIKSIYATDPSDAVRQLATLAEGAEPDDVIRPSHIFSLLINHHAGKESWNAAYRCITQLKKQQPKLDLTTVVSAEILDKICDEMRVDRVTSSAKGAESEEEEGEEVDFSHAMKKRQNEPLF